MTRFDALNQLKREQPSLSEIVRAVGIALAVFCVVYFGGQLLRGAF